MLLLLLLLLHINGDDKFEAEEDTDCDDDEKENEDVKPSFKKARLGTNSANVDITNFLTPLKQQQPWMPSNLMAVWENESLQKIVTVVIALDAGIDADKDVTISVSDDGRNLVIEQKMLERISNVTKLHDFFRQDDKLAYPSYHPAVIAFRKHVKSLKVKEGDAIMQKASIKLPFLVQTDILNDYKFGERDGARVIYVNLRAEVRETYSSNVRSTMKLCF